jgi:hypothetical protein
LNGLWLEIAFDGDLAERVQRRTGVRLSRISVFGVYCPFLLLEGIGADPAAALLRPKHVVIRESRGSAVVSVAPPPALRTSGLPPAIAIPIHRSRLSQALEDVGGRDEGFPIRGKARLTMIQSNSGVRRSCRDETLEAQTTHA